MPVFHRSPPEYFVKDLKLLPKSFQLFDSDSMQFSADEEEEAGQACPGEMRTSAV